MRVCSLCRRCYADSVVSCTEVGHPPLSETRNGSPEMIAGYRLDYLLESFINGEIYRARQTDSGRACRIKILFTDAQSSQQFLVEAKLAAGLFHPSVADVYEAGSLEKGEVFVVAEDPEGESLRELLNNVGIPHLLTSIQVVRQTAEALHVLHLKGLTHRAVAPENIVLTTDAEHRLLVRIKDPDFGGVIGQSIVSNKFFVDSAINSLKYFAPEQCSGEAVGVKSDVYALGIVLYEMLAGTPPFDGEKAAALIDKHKNQRPPDIRINNFELRMLVTHTLMESLTKHPETRQSSANAFARQMRHIEQLATHVSTPPPAGIVPPAPPRTAPVVTAAAAARARSPIIQPAQMTETRKLAYGENIQPVTAVIEHEPVSIFKGDSSFTAFKDESDEIAVVDPGGFADELIEKPGLLSEEPAVENFVTVSENFQKERSAPPVSRLSRLRTRMKKLHPKTAPPSPGMPEIQSVPAVEPIQLNPVPIQAVPAEIAAARSEPPTPFLPAEEGWPKAGVVGAAGGGAAGIKSVSSTISAAIAEAALSIDEFRPPTHAGGSDFRREPARIEWEQPEDDIPSAADVLEVLSKEQMPEIPIVHAEPKKIAAVPLRRQPARIEWEQPKDDIPSAAGVLEALSKKQLIEIPVVQVEPEEITLVSAPGRRIKIEWEQPRTPQVRLAVRKQSMHKRDEVRFFPTILGASGNRQIIDVDTRDSMFSAYYPASRARFSVPYRSLVIGGGFMALLVVFLFGHDLVGRYAATGTSGDSVEAKTTSAKEIPPQSRQKDGVTPAKRKAIKSFRQPVPEDNAPVKAGVQNPLSKIPGVQNQLSKTPTVNRNGGKMPLVPSTLVISSENGKIKLKTEPQKNSADKNRLSSPNKTANSIRPRFVKDPKP